MPSICAHEVRCIYTTRDIHSPCAVYIVGIHFLDTISGPARNHSTTRGEFSSSRQDLSDRADTLFAFAGRMKRLASLYDCLFLVINQVSGVFEKYPAPAGMADSFLPNGHELNQTALIPPFENVL